MTFIIRSFLMFKCLYTAVLTTLFISACANTTGTQQADTSKPSGNFEEISVGETKHLTVYIGDICGEAPSFAEVSKDLPPSSIVRYSDGGLGNRDSRRCGGEVEGRRILATGLAAGTETHRYEAGSLTIIVE